VKKVLATSLGVGLLGLSSFLSAENEATYDSATGILHIPKVMIGSETYQVDMQQTNGLDFSVTIANSIPDTDNCTSPGYCTVERNGLLWQQADDGITRTWEEADSYCSNLFLAENNDWRLPLKHELEELVFCSNGTSTPLQDGHTCSDGNSQREYDYPTIDSSFSSHVGSYWTSSIYIIHEQHGKSLHAVSFSNGITGSSSLGSNRYYYARCVRSQ